MNGPPESGFRAAAFSLASTLPLEFWGPLAEKLSTIGRVICFDQRNAGGTQFEGEFTLGDVASDATRVLSHLGVQQAIVIGHAWGGRVAQVFARDFPDCVSHLVIIGTGGQFPPVDMSETAALAQQARKRDDRTTWEHYFEKQWFGAGFANREPMVFHEVTELLWHYHPPRLARWNARAYPSGGYWGSAKMPTLLIYGSEDKNGTPENAADLEQRLSHSRLLMIEGTGHFVVREAPDRILVAISEFLAETETA